MATESETALLSRILGELAEIKTGLARMEERFSAAAESARVQRDEVEKLATRVAMLEAFQNRITGWLIGTGVLGTAAGGAAGLLLGGGS